MFALTVGLIAFVIYQVFSFLAGTKSFRRRVKRELNQLREQIHEIREALIPFESEEFKIVSSSPVIKKKKRGKNILFKGFVSTIYQEPVLAFAIKHDTVNDKMILVLASDKDEYNFILDDDKTKVTRNDQILGYIDSSSRLIDERGNILARLESDHSNSYYIISRANNEILAHINKYDAANISESDRLFSLFHEFKTNDEDELLALSMYSMFIKPRIENSNSH